MAAREAQLEELEALTAIYASDFLPDNHDADAAEDLSATARAEVELPEEGLVLEISDKAGAGSVPAAQISHLPPIILHLVFPSGYPDSEAPQYSLEAFWLSLPQRRKLHEHLQELWQEQAGAPICYTWIDWLQSSALAHLGISDTLRLAASSPQPRPGFHSTPLPSSAASAAPFAPSTPPSTPQPAADTSPTFPGQATSQPAAGSSQASLGQLSSQPNAGAPPSPSAKSPHQARRASKARAKGCTASPRSGPQPAQGSRPASSTPACAEQSQLQGSSTPASGPPAAYGNGAVASSTLRQGALAAASTSSCASAAPQQGAHGAGEPAAQANGTHASGTTRQDARKADEARQGPEAASGSRPSTEQVLMRLLQYDASRRMDLFRQSLHTCNICFEEQPGTAHAHGGECEHHFCRSCLGQHAGALISQNALDQLRCPEPSCRQPLQRHKLGELLQPDVLAQWDAVALDQALAKMADVVICNRCSTPCMEDKDHMAQCPKCFFVFCGMCKDAWHPGRECLSVEMKLRYLRERKEGGQGDARHLIRLEQELLNLASIKETAKNCPHCNMAVEKSEGCNKMVCGHCAGKFCYKCGQAIRGYEHFRGECELFDRADVEAWAQMAPGEIDFNEEGAWENEFPHEVRRAPARDRNETMCPTCAQPNRRAANNNHMLCWACDQHFCFLCRTRLKRRGGGHHFSANTCPQHTVL